MRGPATAASLMALCNCATVFRGTEQSITLDTQPEGAMVYLDGNRIGQTPMQFRGKSGQDYYFQFRAEGFETRTMAIRHSVGAGWVVLDILLPGWVIWVLVDALTSAWFYFDQEHINVLMDPIRVAPPPTPWRDDS